MSYYIMSITLPSFEMMYKKKCPEMVFIEVSGAFIVSNDAHY